MENITINQKQLFNVIKRTMSFSKEYAIEKLDADGNFIVFINGDFTDFFILSKSLVDYISTKSSAYSKLQETYIEFTESANARAKELFKREDEIKSLNEELNSVVKHNKTEIAILKDTIEELRAKIKTQDAIIEINKEKIEKQDKEIQSYKNINKQSKSDL